MSRRFAVSVRHATIAIVLAGLLAACDEETAAEQQEEVIRPVRAMRVGNIEALEERAFSGRAQAAREVTLEFRVSGEVIELPVAVGDVVEEGQLLAALDPDTYQAEVDRERANLASAEAVMANAENDAERDRQLIRTQTIAQARLDQTLATLDQARAEVAATVASLGRAELDLSYTRLLAPFAGTVVATYVETFEDVQGNQPVVRLLDPSQIEMVVDIPETLIALAPSARDIIVEFDAFPGLEIPAVITEIGSEASETTRTFPVTLTMDQPEGVTILPGMAGRATGQPPEEETVNTLIIPISAVFGGTAEQDSFVWVVDEDSMSVHQRPVQLGETTAQGLIIDAGLERGEIVVTAGVHMLVEAQEVRLLDE